MAGPVPKPRSRMGSVDLYNTNVGNNDALADPRGSDTETWRLPPGLALGSELVQGCVTVDTGTPLSTPRSSMCSPRTWAARRPEVYTMASPSVSSDGSESVVLDEVREEEEEASRWQPPWTESSPVHVGSPRIFPAVTPPEPVMPSMTPAERPLLTRASLPEYFRCEHFFCSIQTCCGDSVLSSVAVLSLSIGTGIGLSWLCCSPLLVIFTAELVVIILWVYHKRPLISITMVYVLTCMALLSRETALVFSGRYPCGLSTYGSKCVESRCEEFNHFLWLKTNCLRLKCTREVEGLTRRIYLLPATDFMTAWMIGSLVCVWLTFVLTLWHLGRWSSAQNTSSSSSAANSDDSGMVTFFVPIILAVPTVYGLCATHALRTVTASTSHAWNAEAMMDAAAMFSAISIFAFWQLLVIYVKLATPNKTVSDIVRRIRPSALGRASMQTLNVMQALDSGVKDNFKRLVDIGVAQYVLLVFGCNVIEVIAKLWDWFHSESCARTLKMVLEAWLPEYKIKLSMNLTVASAAGNKNTEPSSLACENLWGPVSIVLSVADFFTCGIALASILAYEHAFENVLEPVRPKWKFLGVKGLLSVGFLQKMTIMACSFFFVGKAAAELTHLRPFLNYFLISVEVLVLACLNIWAYPPSVPCDTKLRDQAVLGDACCATNDANPACAAPVATLSPIASAPVVATSADGAEGGTSLDVEMSDPRQWGAS
eukprot:TRINITY_DN69541_c0_g1_i1.p1 TRINITY_DN69541_c0_g1~~TRINITY_DN69541_c0_g1_i1.p1  ORF type:complete len:736 (-),score=109.50 TRINITY_DN69541_c0_g1_i1:173-2308(-)